MVVLICLVLVIPCTAEVIVVDPNGSADYTSIQDAIDYSWHGDTVVVNPGIYREDIYFNSRAITLTCTDPDESKLYAAYWPIPVFGTFLDDKPSRNSRKV